MSLIALAAGVGTYLGHRHLRRFLKGFKPVDARLVFEGSVQCVGRYAEAWLGRFDNASLQRYMSLLLLTAVVLAGSGCS